MKIDLRMPDLRKVPVGTVVITSKGFEFELMFREAGKELWKDCTARIFWHDVQDEKFSYKQAVDKFGDSLPSKEEFEIAEEHGFREVVPNMNRWFWSSSASPYSTGSAYGFDGDDGGIDYAIYRNYKYGSVRCVGR